MSRPQRVLGYARVSSAEQALGTSLQDQQDVVTAYAKARGLTISQFYVEAESAVAEKFELRDQIQALMLDMRKGDLILCDKVDRWSRDPGFTYNSVKKILKSGASFYAVGDQCDPSTDEGDTMLNFRVLFAREEHKRIKVRMVGTRAKLADRGFFVTGRTPYGYRRPNTDDREIYNILEPVESEAVVVKRIYDLCILGHAYRQIAETVGLQPSAVRDILRRRTYLGESPTLRGVWVKGLHPAIIDPDTFIRAQAALVSRRHSGPKPRTAASQTSEWILRDVAVCGHCDARMSAAYGGQTYQRHYYYRCSRRCVRAHIPVFPVERQFRSTVLGRLTELIDRLGVPFVPQGRAPVDVEEACRKLEVRKQRVIEMYMDLSISKAEMSQRVAKIEAERLKLEARMPRPSPLQTPEIRREVLSHVTALRDAWELVAGAKARVVVNRLAVKVGLVKGADPVPTWRDVEELARDR